MQLKHIKSNDDYWRPSKNCIIKKLLFGRWQIDYYDEYVQFHVLGGHIHGEELKPNARVILYPSGIEEIRYEKQKP